MKRNDEGLSEILDSTLIIVLGVVLAVITLMLVLGVIPLTEKTAYLVPRFDTANISGKTVITVFDLGGDPVYFNGSPLAKYRADLYVDTQSGSFRAVPAPTLTVLKPGDTVYTVYTGTGFVLTDRLSGTSFVSLPAGKISVRFVDATSGVLISKEDLVKGTATTTTTAVPTTTTPVPTITTPVPTTTTPLPTLAAGFTWKQDGKSSTVTFTDASTGSPTSWSWNFGDTQTGTGQPVTHHFSDFGSYQVRLNVTRSSDGATSSITKTVTITKT